MSRSLFASELGRRTSRRKARTSRANGKKSGRPVDFNPDEIRQLKAAGRACGPLPTRLPIVSQHEAPLERRLSSPTITEHRLIEDQELNSSLCSWIGVYFVVVRRENITSDVSFRSNRKAECRKTPLSPSHTFR